MFSRARNYRNPCGLVTAFACAALAAADHPLQYRFAPGLQVTYELRTALLPLAGGPLISGQVDRVRATCLRADEGESLLLLDVLGTTAGRVAPARGLLLYVEDKTARRRFPPESVTRVAPFEFALDVIPILPLQVQSDAEWDTPPDLFGRRWHCTNRGRDPKHDDQVRIEFRQDDPTGVAAVLGRTLAGQFLFDTSSGWMTRLEAEQRDEHSQRVLRIEAAFQETRTESAAWALRRADEADKFLKALRNEDRLLHTLATQPAGLARTLEQLERVWSDFRSAVDIRTSSPFQRLADARRVLLRTEEPDYRAIAALGQRWMNQPARGWSLQDPAGHTRTSEELRKGIVLECFWTANTEAGLRSLAALQQLKVEAYRPQTTVLAYNMDNGPEAGRAIERCGTGLTHILGGPLRESEKLPELPIVRVLDPAGIVRDIWVGWQPDYQPALEAAWKR